MFALELLNVHTVVPYSGLTFPHFRSRLESLSLEGSMMAVGASVNGQPVGLALADVHTDDSAGEVCSLFVTPAYRGCGIGTALLDQIEMGLQKRGCSKAWFRYTAGKATTSTLEGMLHKGGWEEPEVRRWICKADRHILDAPWMKRRHLPDSFALFPWQELTPTERDAMKKEEGPDGWLPEGYTPFDDEHLIEPTISLGLRYQSEVVGWMFVHRVSEGVVRYHHLFVREDLRRKRCGLPMLVESIWRQAETLGSDSCGVFIIGNKNPTMRRFLQRQIAPYLVSVQESRGTWKDLMGEQKAVVEAAREFAVA